MTDSRFAFDRIVIHYADIALKGRNRPRFEARLGRQIEWRLKRLGLPWPVRRAGGRMAIEIGAESERLDEVLALLGETPGIAIYFPARWFSAKSAGRSESEFLRGPVPAALLALARSLHREGARFAVRVERHDPGLELSGTALEVALGSLILAETPWEGVNLSAPDRTFHVGLYPEGAFLSAERRRGLGGMPVGTAGRVVALLSGGIDSPLAAFLMARRGCAVDCLHFSAGYPSADDIAQAPPGRLAALLSRYAQTLRLHVLPYVNFDLALTGPATGHELLLFRRFMLRAAERLAQRSGASALVTGDSLSQVASQTLANLVSLDAAVAMPVFRPLIGLNKPEIIAWAREIGSYPISIDVYKDCCALIARNPKTQSLPARMDEVERERLGDYAALIEATLAQAVSLHFEAGERVAEPSASL